MATADQLRQERDLTTIRNQIAIAESRLLAAHKAPPSVLPPIVKAGAPCIWSEDAGKWLLHFPISTSLREVESGRKVYRVPDQAQHPFTVHLYLKLSEPDWPCILGQVTTEHGITMPHIDSYGACMASDLAPKSLLTLEDYKAVKDILVKHCQGIRLDSLYTGPTYWPEEIMDPLPEEMVKWLNNQDPDTLIPINHLFTDEVGEWEAEVPEEDPEPDHDEYDERDESEPEPEAEPQVLAEVGQDVWSF